MEERWRKTAPVVRRLESTQQMKVQNQPVLLLALMALLAQAPLYGQPSLSSVPPEPPKADVPYLIHANKLVETEQAQAVEQSSKKEQTYHVPGATSGVRTPMAGPEFLLKVENLDPDRLQLYRFESRNGRREILIRKKKKIVAKAYYTSTTRVSPGILRIRVDQFLENGEYCLTPSGSDAVFCFTVH